MSLFFESFAAEINNGAMFRERFGRNAMGDSGPGHERMKWDLIVEEPRTLHRRSGMMQAQNNLAIGENLPPRIALFQMASSYWVSQAIYVAVRLGIADLLKDGPMSYLELAEATASHPASLRRLLRALASLGVLATEQNYTFELTPIGASLQSTGLASTALTPSFPLRRMSWLLIAACLALAFWPTSRNAEN